MRWALVLCAVGVLSACKPGAAKPDAGIAVSEGGTNGGSLLDAGSAATDDASREDSLPASNADLTARARHLLEAISRDDVSLGTDILFPRDAYISVRDAADPGREWDIRVSGLFQKQVHALHRKTKGIERAEFVNFELGEPIVQAVVKKHDLKRSLWRVHHSRVTYTIDGTAQHFDIGEMTSWQGAWYVTKLRSER